MARVAVVRKVDNVCVAIIMATVEDPAREGCFHVDVDYTPCNLGWIARSCRE